MKIARVATVLDGFVHIRNMLREISQYSEVEITLIAKETAYISELKKNFNFKFIPINIERDISIFKDLSALFKLFFIFLRYRFDIVHSSTPKAGLLTSIAGFLAHIKVRVHTFTGQRWVTMSGKKKWLLKKFDRLIIILNTCSFADSFSQIEFLKKEGVAKDDELFCQLHGSFGGVDTSKFSIEFNQAEINRVKKELGICKNTFIFLGRIQRDKGIFELLETMRELPNSDLLLVGARELSEADEKLYLDLLMSLKNVKEVGFQTNPAPYLGASDILVLPSYREGFGTVVIEAACLKIPSIGTRIPGLEEAIVDGETGLLVSPKDIIGLKRVMKNYQDSAELRKIHGENAYKRALLHFDYKIHASDTLKRYKELLNKNSESRSNR